MDHLNLHSPTSIEFFSLLLFLLVAACNNESQRSDADTEARAVEIANQLLDDDIEAEQRRDLVEQNLDMAPQILTELVRNLETGTDEEARRIPWIWRVTIAVGSQSNSEEIRQIMDISLPELNAPLLNWQGVVLGGGIVNGISRQNEWPKSRIDDILNSHENLQARWQRAIELSYEMAKDPEVPYPWRYDALRMIAMDLKDQSIPELTAYLDPELDNHLHMGAISGLADIRSPEVPEILLSGISYYSDRNRDIALNALLRSDERIEVLLNAINDGTLSADDLGEERIKELKSIENEALRERARQVIGF